MVSPSPSSASTPATASLSLLPPKDYAQVKVVSLGDSCVGKSCLIKRYCEKKFVSKYISTIGIDFGVRPFPLTRPHSTPPPPPFSLRLNFFDLSGSPHYRSIRTVFYSDAQLLLACFDVNNRASFEHLPGWLQEVDDSAHRDSGQLPPLVCVCACMSGEEGCADDDGDEGGMSSRRRRAVPEAEARRWAEARGFLYHEVSAKTGRGVEGMFDDALHALAKRLQLI